jgi:signal transduction histidine kinase
VLYSIPTLSFIIMTIVTISSFVSAHGSGAVHATGLALVIRCLSGWFFGVIELLYASLGKNSQQTFSPQQVIDQMAAVVATTTATFDRAIENTVAAITARTQQQLSSQIASVQFQITQKVASEVATFEKAIEQKVANLISQIQIAPPSISTQGITDEQFNLLVELINQQATTIQQLSSSLAEVRREVRTTVTEIRSFTQETTAIQAPASTKALPASRTVESDAPEGTEADKRANSIEKPGQRVQRFLQECQARNYKPKLQEIQDICQVAKKTATTYRQNFYGEGESSQTEEEE